MEETHQVQHPRTCHVVIVTHEGEKQHEQTCAGMLTQFFVDNNNVATGVKSYVIDNAIGDRVVKLQPSDNYCKKLCNIQHLMNLQWLPSPVMFIQCHGSPGSAARETPHLLFSQLTDVNVLYPCSGYSEFVWLHHVICKSRLVFLMCCHCEKIVPAYLKERSNDFPDIVYYNCGSVMQITHSIFVGWLIKMMDSSRSITCNPSSDALYHGVKVSVLGIMSIVQQCKNEHEFFDHLTDSGCITKYTTEKEKEEEELPAWRFQQPQHMQDFYRLYGHTKNEWMLGPAKQKLFHEFQTLTLLEAGKEDTRPVYTTYRDSPAPSQQMQNTDNVYALLSQLKAISS